MPAALESNIWKYTVLLVTNKRVFVAILGAYYLTIPGVNAWWIGALLSIGNIAGFVLEVPSGYFADKIGHKQTLLLARVFAFCSSIFFLFATSIPFLVIASIFLSASFAFHSGTGSAFMHETLRALSREDEYQKVAGKQSAIGFAVPAVLMTLIPFLVGISYQIPFLVALLIDAVGVITAFSLTVPSVTPEHVAEVQATNAVQVFRDGLRLHFFRFAIFGGFVSGTLMSLMAFRAPYQLLLGVPVIWFGIFFGAGRALASLMLAWSGRIHRRIGDIFAFERIQILLYTLLIGGLAAGATPWVVVSLFMLGNAFQWGLSQIETGYLLEIIRESKFKATLLSVDSQMSNIFTALIAVGLGYAVSWFGYQQAFLVLCAVFLVTLIPLYVFLTRARGKISIRSASSV